jgi:hypothetical protein
MFVPLIKITIHNRDMEKKKRNRIILVILFIVSIVIISAAQSSGNDIASGSSAYQSGWKVGTCVRNALQVMVSYQSN